MAKKAASKKPPPPPWPPPEVVAQYASLEPDTQTMAIALAILDDVFFHSDLPFLLKEIGARDVAKRSFSSIRARGSLKKLIAIGWVEHYEQENFFLIESLVNPLLEIAARNDRLRLLAANYLNANLPSPGIGELEGGDLIRLARLAFFTRDWELLESLDRDHNRDPDGFPEFPLFLFLSPTPYRELLQRLPKEFLNHAVYQIGTNLSRVQSPLADFLPQAYLLVRDNPEHARFLSEILYFRGDLVRLGKLRTLLDARPELPEAQIEAKQIAGAIAFLEGDDSIAVARFEEALEAIKQSTGERSYFIGGYAGIFFLLALARSGSTGFVRATQLTRLACEIYDAPWISPILNLRDAFDFASGLDNERFGSRWGAAVPAELLIIAWTELWTETIQPPDMRRFDRLMFDAENAEANGNTWLAAELFEIASRIAQTPHDQAPREKAATPTCSDCPRL